jgi:hypothetical protein
LPTIGSSEWNEDFTLYTVQQAKTIGEQEKKIEQHKSELNRKDAEISTLNARLASIEQTLERLAKEGKASLEKKQHDTSIRMGICSDHGKTKNDPEPGGGLNRPDESTEYLGTARRMHDYRRGLPGIFIGSLSCRFDPHSL